MKEKTQTTHNLLTYKGYVGSIDIDVEAEILYGKILGIGDVISYQGTNLAELKADFEDAISEYIEHCKKHNKKPDKSYSGKILLRLTPELHSKVALTAKSSSASINSIIASAIEQYIADSSCRA